MKFFGNPMENVTKLVNGKWQKPAIKYDHKRNCFSGPCKEDEILAIGSRRNPECSSTLRTLSKTASLEEPDKKKPETRIEFSQDRPCHEKWKVSYNGSCFPLLEQGPCPEGEWLVVSPGQGDSDDFLEYLGVGVSVTCVTRPCDERDGGFWWPELCECVSSEPGVTRYTVSDVCGDQETMVVSPQGRGVCTCQPGYSYDEVSPDMSQHCHTESLQHQVCQQNEELKERLFDQIPINTAQAKKCYVDERGKCRTLLRVRGLFGEETDLEFTHWIKSFSNLRGSGNIYPGILLRWTRL